MGISKRKLRKGKEKFGCINRQVQIDKDEVASCDLRLDFLGDQQSCDLCNILKLSIEDLWKEGEVKT